MAADVSSKIPLTQGYFATVDDEDFEYLSQWSWYVVKKSRNFYAVRGVLSKGKRKTIFMHREIMECDPNEIIDHINQNGLDNRKSNLRKCNKSQNSMNTKKRETSKYKGVYKDKGPGRIKRYKAHIHVNKKRICLGIFLTAEEAAIAYNDAALKYHGEFACLNQL